MRKKSPDDRDPPVHDVYSAAEDAVDLGAAPPHPVNDTLPADHEAHYRTLLDAVPDAVTLHDEQGNILDANAAATRIFGYSLEALRRMNVRDINPNLPADHVASVIRSRGLGEAFSVVTVNRRADGSSFPVEVHSNVFLDAGRRRVIAVARDISKRLETERKLRISAEYLRHQARVDALTGLPNRDTTLEMIRQAIEQVDGNGSDVPAVLYIDLDRFKILNDMLGHSAGDHLLLEAADRLRDCCEGVAKCGRYGSDEFIVLLPHSNGPGAARELARRIIKAFGRPFEHAGEAFALTVSIGIAHYPAHGRRAEELIQHADSALHEAKRRGRHTYRSFDRSMSRDSGIRRQVEAQLRLALDHKELTLTYQPKISLLDNRVSGVEALLRWKNPFFGEVAPTDFIPHAENSGEIVRIGAWVVEQACGQLRAWRESGLELDHVAVNVSFRQLLSGAFCDRVQAVLESNGLHGSSLELEMTERILIEEAPDTLDIFTTLKDMGVRMTIDDFGEGYSSFNYLRHLPIDNVKISHTFMQGIPQHPTDAAICEAIVRIADSLGLGVIAEGVETEEQRRFLLGIGTDHAQGFLFSPPLPAPGIPAFLDTWRGPRQVPR